MSISIRKEENGFVLTNHSAGAVEPTWVFQGIDAETIDEMLAQVRLMLLEEPDELPLPHVGILPLASLLPDETPPPDFGVDAFMRDEAPNETQI